MSSSGLASTVTENGLTAHDNIPLAPLRDGTSQAVFLEESQDRVDTTTPKAPALQKWNYPDINKYRYFATLYSFVIMGMNDATYGALIPYLETYYDISYTVVSLVFLSPAVGYILAAFLNHKIHTRFGQLGCAIIAPTCHLIAYVVTCIHPPYPLLPIVFMLAGLGTGILDGAWNAWIGNMANANQLLGFLHGAYGLGAAFSPLVATTMITQANLQWYAFFYVMVGMSAIELLVCALTFRKATGAEYRAANPSDRALSGKSTISDSLRNYITWICASFLLCYVGVEVALGGWLVDFMLRVRHGAPFASGLVAMGFWLGLAIGRITLGFITAYLGEKFAIATYLLGCMGLELCFWLIPNFISSAVFAALLGYFLGPMFPAAVVVATKLLPQRLHVSAIGFAAAFGGTGAAIFPFAVGAIAQSKGVQVLQPIIFALLAVDLGLWCLLPGGFKKRGLEEVHREREERNSVQDAAGGQEGTGGLRRRLRSFTKKA